MAEQMRPASKESAPDPSNAYERSHPSREAGMGRMDPPTSTPAGGPDAGKDAVKNAQDPTRQVNAQDDPGRGSVARQRDQQGLPPQPDHSMKEEEPLGWDQAPTGATDPEQKRHPRTEGKGGTP